MSRPLDMASRLMHRVEFDTNGGCWLWTGSMSGEPGYMRPQVSVSKYARLSASRSAYEEFVGTIPEGLMVLHRCDIPSCVNPAHLFLGTNADNMSDMAAKNRGKKPRNASSGLTGVYRNPGCLHRPWMAQIRIGGDPGQLLFLGTFEDPQVAHQAYLAARICREALVGRLNGRGVQSPHPTPTLAKPQVSEEI